MRISDILKPEFIKLKLENNTKQTVIEELVDLLPESQKNTRTRLKLIKAILDRENICSTGVGEGVAIPHARVDQPGTISLALGFHPHGIDFDSIDGKPSRIFFLLLAGNDAGTLHLKILARISRLMHQESYRNALINCSSTAEVIEFFHSSEGRNIHES